MITGGFPSALSMMQMGSTAPMSTILPQHLHGDIAFAENGMLRRSICCHPA
jgi:hypothetical protein